MKGLRHQAMFLPDQLPGGSQSLGDMAAAALDVITAFAVPSLNTSSQGVVEFFGFGCLPGCPGRLVTQSTSEFATSRSESFSTVDISTLLMFAFE
jgi:hypothetical protein